MGFQLRFFICLGMWYLPVMKQINLSQYAIEVYVCKIKANYIIFPMENVYKHLCTNMLFIFLTLI